MLLRARSEVCRRSTSFLREVPWLERVPAENRAMNSLSWALLFSGCVFCASMRERICVLMAARRALHFELDIGARDVAARQVGGLQALHFLLARGDLAR